MALSKNLVSRMYRDYSDGMSLHGLQEKYGRDRRSIREVFERRGLAIRPLGYTFKRLENGRIAPVKPKTGKEITELINKLTRIQVPLPLKQEWRHWSWVKRRQFLKRVRTKFPNPERDMPTGPFSKGLEPFDYCSTRAVAISKAWNEGRDTHHFRTKLKLASRGVIFEGRLFFWMARTGYFETYPHPYVPGKPRVLLHLLIWERHHGHKVPPQHIISFLDGNQNNHDPKNLGLKSMWDNLQDNRSNYFLRKARMEVAEALEQTHEIKRAA